MEKLLHITRFRSSHTIPIGKRVNLSGYIFCNPNYKADEIELIQADHFPDYLVRKNYLKIHPKNLAKNISADFYDRIEECCRLYTSEIEAMSLTDYVIDKILKYKWKNNSKYRSVTNTTLIEFILQAFQAHGIDIPKSNLPVQNWESIIIENTPEYCAVCDSPIRWTQPGHIHKIASSANIKHLGRGHGIHTLVNTEKALEQARKLEI